MAFDVFRAAFFPGQESYDRGVLSDTSNHSDAPITSIKVNIDPDVKSELIAFCERSNRTQKGFLRSLLTWFFKLDRSTQALILKEIEDTDEPALAKAILKRISSSSSSKK